MIAPFFVRLSSVHGDAWIAGHRFLAAAAHAPNDQALKSMVILEHDRDGLSVLESPIEVIRRVQAAMPQVPQS